MQDTTRHYRESQLSRDSLMFSETFVPFRRAPQNSDEYALAFMCGADQLRIYLEEYLLQAYKLNKNSTDFERGQREMIEMVIDQVNTLLGR